MAWFDEGEGAGVVDRLEGESCLVDGDVVVEPAECGEVVGVVVAVVGSVFDVVGLEPVAAGAAGDGAAFVPPCNEAAHRRWDRGGRL